MERRIAAIDIGTNSTKVFVALVEGGEVNPVQTVAEVTRLGEGVDATKRLKPEAIERTIKAIVRFVGIARDLGAEKIVAAGTSALRDAENGQDFLDAVREQAHLEVEIISGDREANLSYSAVASDHALAFPKSGKRLVFDIGGGSTELIVGTRDGVERFRSLEIGAVRLTERLVKNDPPSPEDVAAVRKAAAAAIASFGISDIGDVVGVGGTASNVASVARESEEKIHGVRITRKQLGDVIARFLSVPVEERRKITALDPPRADVIPSGALILDEILEAAGADSFTLSLRGVRFGLVAENA
jgi:exopolyphosphatase/guanosine-5'-triphosphate,3'-diphosphate pyrophosphatase